MTLALYKEIWTDPSDGYTICVVRYPDSLETEEGGCLMGCSYRRGKLWTELRQREIRPRFAQDLVRPAQLTVLPLTLSAAQTDASPPVRLRLTHPPTQHLSRTPKLLRDRDNGRPLRGILSFIIENQPHRPFPKLRGEFN